MADDAAAHPDILNQAAQGQLKSIVERIERLEQEKSALVTCFVHFAQRLLLRLRILAPHTSHKWSVAGRFTAGTSLPFASRLWAWVSRLASGLSDFDIRP